MIKTGERAPQFELRRLDNKHWSSRRAKPALLVFFETDCPTCQLTLPYLDRLGSALGSESDCILAISQDLEGRTRRFAEQLHLRFPIALDTDLSVSRLFDPQTVPTLYLLSDQGEVLLIQVGMDKQELNNIAATLCRSLGRSPIEIADRFDGNPERKPGCSSRHLEEAHAEEADIAEPPASILGSRRGTRAAHIPVEDATDLFEFCMEHFGDALPVIPPTAERVGRMIQAARLPPEEIVAFVPPNYGEATVEKIAANAVMAGCRPEMMRVLLPLVRAACDERFNLHGVQATTHFAAPLVIVNGPVRQELGFACRSNVFSNVARANSTLGRALQLILTNLGGARPGEIDMSTLGNPGKFSYCIAENEEENPWEPLHVDQGFDRGQSAVTLFAAEPPHGVSEHHARAGRVVLKSICRALATVWNYRVCLFPEAVVVLCPEHVHTLHRDGFTKESIREFLFENTGIPIAAFGRDPGEGTQYAPSYGEVLIDGEHCYRKFREPGNIKLVVAGGTAGKFSAVIGSWATGPRGSEMVTYPIGSQA